MSTGWLLPPSDLEISARYIDVWRIQLDISDESVRSLKDLLVTDELLRADKYLSKQKAREFIVTRAALRRILADVLNKKPLDLKFDTDPDGKPRLSDTGSLNQLNFNVSHSHDLALIAITSVNQIGIDIEKIRSDIDHYNLSRRFFSEREFEALQQFSEEKRLLAFFATWTRKEAVVKAIGKGIAKSLKQFDVSVDPYLAPQMTAGSISGIYPLNLLATIDIDSSYYASLAAGCSMSETPLIRQWIL